MPAQKRLSTKEPTVSLLAADGKILDSVNVMLYPEDNIRDLKQKITEATGIAPYRQHIFIDVTKERESAGPLSYQILLDDRAITIDAKQDLLNKNANKSSEMGRASQSVLGLPIDMHLYQSHDTISVLATDEFVTLRILAERGYIAPEFQVIDIDAVISPIKEQLITLMQSDDYQFRLIYFGFVIKFWPMFTTPDIFKLWLREGDGLRQIYPDLDIRRNYATENAILAAKYKMSTDNKAVVDITIKNAVIHIDPPVLPATTILSVANLFSELHCDNTKPFIRCNLPIHNKPVLFTRLLKNNSTQVVYENVRQRIGLQYTNTIAIVTLAELGYFIIVVYENGFYQIRTAWGDEIKMTFDNIFNSITAYAKPVIDHINSMGRGIFTNNYKLHTPVKRVARISGLHLSILYKKPFNSTALETLGTLLAAHVTAGFLLKAEETPNGVTGYYFIKGVSDLDKYTAMTNLQGNINQYAHLTDAKLKQQWPISRRYMIISHSTASVKAEIYDLQESEFDYFYEYIIYLFDTAASAKKSTSKQVDVKSLLNTTNRLKLLKTRDPELYVFNRKYGSDLVYSRVCQKEHQPIIFDEAEYDQLDPSIRKKITKYWNFTTSRPAYYYCPNAKFPYLNFIVGQHPRGYCLPCCKKTPPTDDAVGSRRAHIYNTCMTCHSYDKATLPDETVASTSSRYIMNYGKSIEIGRIGQLPDILGRYFQYNLPAITSTDGDAVHFDGAVYSLKKLAAHRNIKSYAISHLKVLVDEKGHFNDPTLTIATVLATPNKYSNEFNKISNASKQPIICLEADNKSTGLRLIEGIDRLAKAIYLKQSDIDVLRLTSKQLAKSIKSGDTECTACSGATPITNLFHKTAYYLYGVAQHGSSIQDIGAAYGLAAALDISLYELTEQLLGFMRPNHFNMLMNGSLSASFDNFAELITLMKELFMADSTTLANTVKFSGWNALFIELVELCFNKRIIIFDERDEIHIVYQSEIDPTKDTSEYILMWRTVKKERSFFGDDHIYYPIFLVTPLPFFRSSQVDRRIFTKNDAIIELIRKMTATSATHNALFADIKTITYYTNSRGEAYSVLIDGKYTCPIPSMIPPSGAIVAKKPPRLDHSMEYNELLKFFRHRAKGEIDYFIEFGGFIIGFAAGAPILHWYFTPQKYSDKAYNNIIKAAADANVLSVAFKEANVAQTIRHLKYDPDEINKAIEAPSDEGPAALASYSAYYARYQYNLFVIEVINAVDNETLAKWRSLYTNCTKLTAAVADVAKKIIKIGNISKNAAEFPNVFTPCAECGRNTPHCDKHKLIVPKKDVPILVDLLVADLRNPLKREALLKSIILENVRNKYNFTCRSNEEIYIKT